MTIILGFKVYKKLEFFISEKRNKNEKELVDQDEQMNFFFKMKTYSSNRMNWAKTVSTS